MIVTIWRHGEAANAVIDRTRELTDTGSHDIHMGCQQLNQHCEQLGLPVPQLLLFSEWIRTRQTAAIVAAQFSDVLQEPCDALIPGRAPGDVDDTVNALLAKRPHVAHVVLISHQPLVSVLVDYYLGTTASVSALVPGGLVTIELDVAAPDCGRLHFCAQPPNYGRH